MAAGSPTQGVGGVANSHQKKVWQINQPPHPGGLGTRGPRPRCAGRAGRGGSPGGRTPAGRPAAQSCGTSRRPAAAQWGLHSSREGRAAEARKEKAPCAADQGGRVGVVRCAGAGRRQAARARRIAACMRPPPAAAPAPARGPPCSPASPCARPARASPPTRRGCQLKFQLLQVAPVGQQAAGHGPRGHPRRPPLHRRHHMELGQAAGPHVAHAGVGLRASHQEGLHHGDALIMDRQSSPRSALVCSTP